MDRKMDIKIDKKSPFFTASIASIIYFIIFLLLKYLLPIKRELSNINIDWQGALLGAIVFWLVIFVVHQYLRRRYSE
jgi:membrane associated rhomboid family serine protease